MKNPSFLELEHISKHYGIPHKSSYVPILKDISLRVETGDAIAIVGPSGSGKSTLLNLIGTLDRPSTGSIFFDDRNLSELKERELAKVRNQDIGFVFQQHHLLPQCTVLENVLIPTLAEAAAKQENNVHERAVQLLEYVGLKERMDARPGQLSGGECQRTAVVRALINRPKLLLADEPTGSLDHASAENLIQLLVDLNKEQDITLIMVTHALHLAQRMKKQFELLDGKLHPHNE
ncbi:ABC transporter ATP-binding protein [bacterium]|nr:ABC transporter ATP-binding protein [bacterium]